MTVRDNRGRFVPMYEEVQWAKWAIWPVVNRLMGWDDPFPVILRAVSVLADEQARLLLSQAAKWDNYRLGIDRAAKLARIADVIRRCADEVALIVREGRKG